MQGEREKSRDQNEGSSQQPPVGQDDEDRVSDQARQQTGGQSATGQTSPAGGAATLTEGTEPDLGSTDADPTGSSGGFIGSQEEDPGDYLQRGGNPESGFAEQGRGAPDQGDIERTGERSENRDADIEGGSGAV